MYSTKTPTSILTGLGSLDKSDSGGMAKLFICDVYDILVLWLEYHLSRAGKENFLRKLGFGVAFLSLR